MRPRRRAIVALLVSWPVATLWLLWIALLAYELAESSAGGYTTCGGAFEGANLPGLFNGCSGAFTGSFSPAVAVVELVVLVGLAVLAAVLLSRWVVAPIRAMADTVERLGPTSLGLRLQPSGPHDETRALAEAVDALLDRVAEGYEAQRRFASTASHELRTPLATQRALIEVSLGGALTPDQLELVSRQLLATNERNERLIDGLLALAETERGLLTHARLPFDRIARDAADSLQPFAKERGVELHVATEPLTVRGELPLLERLVANLVQNAVKYNVADGTVDLGVHADGRLTVDNTGPLVPGEQVAGLFEPFRRASGERLDHGGGVGLGLTIARSIVAAHGGEITARPNPGGGLAVEVRLPPP